ncbi:unnamed protein product [Cylicostephanus goldi]|uniref:Uncharacterized protein n=1 Tax=Cylicostephanus goldi TaxID=71465 RepID=A0A3P6UME9_CYLGO|nr:unnamed protein product [Cylicostephanus goldi]
MVAIVKRTITKKRRPQRPISRPRRQAKIAESTITPSQQVLNVTEVAITDAYVTSGKGKKGAPTKTKSAEPLSNEIIITIIVIIALLGLLFWIFVVLYERERRAKKWEDYKIYKLELREYKRRVSYSDTTHSFTNKDVADETKKEKKKEVQKERQNRQKGTDFFVYDSE